MLFRESDMQSIATRRIAKISTRLNRHNAKSTVQLRVRDTAPSEIISHAYTLKDVISIKFSRFLRARACTRTKEKSI